MMRLRNRVSILLLMNVIIFISLWILKPDAFFAWNNFKAIFSLMTYDLLLASAMTYILILGGIDLSVGSQLALNSVVIASLLKMNFPLGIVLLACLAGAAATGLFNGILIYRFRLAPFLVTLGTMSITRGIAMVSTQGQYISFPKANPLFATFGRYELSFGGYGIPLIFVLTILLILIFDTLLKKWEPLHRSFFVGMNSEAARISGIKSSKTVILGYVISSLFCLLAALFMTANNRIGYSNYGITYEMKAIAAAIVGGASMSGGKGSLWGTVLGVLMLALIGNGFVLLNGNPNWQQAITGIILIIAISFDMIANAKFKSKELIG